MLRMGSMIETLRVLTALDTLLVLAVLAVRGRTSLAVTIDLADREIQMRRPVTNVKQMTTKAAMLQMM